MSCTLTHKQTALCLLATAGRRSCWGSTVPGWLASPQRPLPGIAAFWIYFSSRFRASDRDLEGPYIIVHIPLWPCSILLHGIGTKEVKVTDGKHCDSGPVVAPLETTPSPKIGQNNSSRVSEIVGNPRPRKRLSLSSTVVQGDIPDSVRKLLADRPILVVLDSDISG